MTRRHYYDPGTRPFPTQHRPKADSTHADRVRRGDVPRVPSDYERMQAAAEKRRRKQLRNLEQLAIDVRPGERSA